MNWLSALFGMYQTAMTLEPAAADLVAKGMEIARSPEAHSIVSAIESIFHITQTPNGGVVLTPKATAPMTPPGA